MNARIRRIAALAPMLAASLCAARTASAQLNLEPDETKGVEIQQLLDVEVPKDVGFIDHDGKLVRFGDLLDGERPVILTFNYSSCPQLCSIQLNTLVQVLGDVELSPRDDFRIVTVSIDPKENHKQAYIARHKYLKLYRNPDAAQGWTFLVGAEPQIKTLADAVGFKYRYVEETGEYAHGAALILLTPDGRTSRYLDGLSVDPKTLRLSLVEAADGKIGTLFDRAFLTCFHYDPESGGYVFAISFMRIFGGLVPILFLIVFWWRMSASKGGASHDTRPAEAR